MNKFCAKYFIDATGDGDLAAASGVEYQLGEDGTGYCQPMTLCFNVGNVDFKDLTYFEVRKVVLDLYRESQYKGKIKNPREDVLVFRSVLPNVLHFNSTRIVKRNPIDAEDLTAAEMEAREQMLELFNFLKENFEIFKNSYIINSGAEIGVRESRRIVGKYVMNADDVLSAKKFDDSIARGNYCIDIHNPSGAGTILKKVKEGDYYTIPLRCLQPEKTENLLVAGRFISTTHEAQASARVMPIAYCIGEGAGAAVAAACSDGISVNEVDMVKVHKILDKSGALY